MRVGFAIAPALIAAVATMFAAAEAVAQQSVYTVKHTVSATAADAVKAKAAAMARGRKEAARIVFKRVVPLGSYRRIPELELGQIENMIEGVTVRAEQNSTTTYIATLSFGFDPSSVREALQANGLSVVDRQAPVVRVLPVIVTDGAVRFESREGWGSAWGLQDLTGSLAPLAVVKPDASIDTDKLKAILSGDRAAFDALRKQAGTDKIILAVASQLGKRFGTRLYGADAVGPIDLSRTDRVFGGDAREAAKRAALIAQRVIETRWKIQMGGDSPETMPWAESGAGPSGQSGYGDRAAGVDGRQGHASAQPDGGLYPAHPAPPAPLDKESSEGGSFFSNLFGFGEDEEEKPTQPSAQRLSMLVEFAGLEQWQAIRSELTVVPGLEALEIGTLTARNARVAFNYAGDVERLRSDLASRGLSLRDSGGNLVLVQN